MVKRTVETQIINLSTQFPVISISGPRQSGKTKLIKKLFQNYHYVNLENLDDRALVMEDVRSFLTHYGPGGLVIDEAQRLPELFSYIQTHVDETGSLGKIIISGSQNFLLMEKITQSLAGRVALINLMPFTISELKNLNYWEDNPLSFLYKGMYPALYDRNIAPEHYYPNYLQTYIERDVRSLKNIENLNLFRKFLQLCAGRVGQILNYTSIGNDLGIDHKTVKEWISVLEASYIIFLLSPHYKNFNKRIIRQPKIYFYDTGIVSSLLGIRNEDAIFSHHLKGSLFENFIISEYIKMQLHQGERPDTWFYRDKTGNEIDLILDRVDGLIPVEIKAGRTISTDFFRGLEKYQKISGVSPEHSYLVYSGDTSSTRKHAQVLSWKNLDQLVQY